MEQCMGLDQETRNYIAEKVINLCLAEVFQFRFMQTDPNWANFMYNPETRQVRFNRKQCTRFTLYNFFIFIV